MRWLIPFLSGVAATCLVEYVALVILASRANRPPRQPVPSVFIQALD